MGDVDKDDIKVDISELSIDVRIKNLNGSNLVYHVPRLYDKIIPSDSVSFFPCALLPCRFLPPGFPTRSIQELASRKNLRISLSHFPHVFGMSHQFWKVRPNKIHLKLYKSSDEAWAQL